MLSKSSTVLAMSGLVRVGRVPDVVVGLLAQSPPLILPAVFAPRAHNIHTHARSVSYGLDSIWDPIAGAVARDRGQGPTHAIAAAPELQKHLV